MAFEKSNRHSPSFGFAWLANFGFAERRKSKSVIKNTHFRPQDSAAPSGFTIRQPLHPCRYAPALPRHLSVLCSCAKSLGAGHTKWLFRFPVFLSQFCRQDYDKRQAETVTRYAAIMFEAHKRIYTAIVAVGSCVLAAGVLVRLSPEVITGIREAQAGSWNTRKPRVLLKSPSFKYIFWRILWRLTRHPLLFIKPQLINSLA